MRPNTLKLRSWSIPTFSTIFVAYMLLYGSYEVYETIFLRINTRVFSHIIGEITVIIIRITTLN